MPAVPSWSPAVDLSPTERRVLARCKKQPIFAFLRAVRHQLFDDAFQRELAGMYSSASRGRSPKPPAQMAMLLLLQAARHCSDQDAAQSAATDRAWQLVLGLDPDEDEEEPFGQSTIFDFRLRLIAHDMDRRLVERTIEMAQKSGLFSPKALRAAFDASPLRGAGRVEDTINLLGHAARDLVSTLSSQIGLTFDEVAARAGIPLLTGTSLKAALDIDWSDLKESHQALQTLLAQVQSLSNFLGQHLQQTPPKPPLDQQLRTLHQVLSQDLEPDPSGQGKQIKKGVAKERQISVRDPQMRHGRKSKAVRFDGYKRHLAKAHQQAAGLILAVALTPANRPEGEAAVELFADIERQGFLVHTLDVDRAYLHASAVQWRCGLGLDLNGRAPRALSRHGFGKEVFAFDEASQSVRCPAGQERPFEPGRTVKFEAAICNACPQKAQCTSSSQGRSLTIHPNESQLIELRARQKTSEGRAELRKRTTVEHSLARVGQIQGNKARYIGVRKNLYDLRRAAVVSNLFALRAAGYAEAA